MWRFASTVIYLLNAQCSMLMADLGRDVDLAGAAVGCTTLTRILSTPVIIATMTMTRPASTHIIVRHCTMNVGHCGRYSGRHISNLMYLDCCQMLPRTT